MPPKRKSDVIDLSESDDGAAPAPAPAKKAKKAAPTSSSKATASSSTSVPAATSSGTTAVPAKKSTAAQKKADAILDELNAFERDVENVRQLYHFVELT